MDLRLLIIALWCPQFLSAFTWVDDRGDPGYNCLGKVVDAICCKDSFCKATSETECKEGNKQFLCSWTGSKCISFRDDKNNVCCKSGTADACAKIVQGVCPDNWQVPNGCCSPEASKYNGTLLGVKPGYVCCNAPCAEMTRSGCPLPDSCAPKARAYVQQGNVNYNLGFYQSPLNYAQNALTGKIIPGFGYGFGGDYGKSVLDSFGYGNSKDSQVDEITVDDLMSLLIDSLADDKDAMVYDSELTSDPFLGKTKSGGSVASMNLPNPNIFLDRIYGSPFGLSQGQMGNYPSLSSPYDSFYGGYGAMTTGYPGYGYMGSQAYPAQYPQQPYQAWPQTSYPPAQLQYGYPQQPQSPTMQYGMPQQAAAQYATQPQLQYMVQQAQPQYGPQQPQYLQYSPQQPQYAPPQPQYAPQQPQGPPQLQYAPQQPQGPSQPQYAPQQVQLPPQQQYAPQQVQGPPQPQYAPQQVQLPPQQQYAPQQQVQIPPQQQYAPQQQVQPPPQPQYAGSPPAQVQNVQPGASAPQVLTTPLPKPPQTQPPPAPQPGPIYKS